MDRMLENGELDVDRIPQSFYLPVERECQLQQVQLLEQKILEAYSRNSLMKILESAKTDDEELSKLLKESNMFTNLDDLIHNSLASSIQLSYMSNDDELLKGPLE